MSQAQTHCFYKGTARSLFLCPIHLTKPDSPKKEMLYELIDAACSNSILSSKILFHFKTTSYRTGSKIYTTMDIRP